MLLLQREIPESVNAEVAKVCVCACVFSVCSVCVCVCVCVCDGDGLKCRKLWRKY